MTCTTSYSRDESHDCTSSDPAHSLTYSNLSRFPPSNTSSVPSSASTTSSSTSFTSSSSSSSYTSSTPFSFPSTTVFTPSPLLPPVQINSPSSPTLPTLAKKMTRSTSFCSSPSVLVAATLAFIVASLTTTARANELALLAGTLRTFQRHACDSTTLLLQCPKNTTIDVTYAHYGRPRPLPDMCPPLAHHTQPLPHTTCKFPGATDYTTLQRVVGQCQHQNDCKIQVAPGFFSDHDPCPLIRKYIEVAYKCRPEAFVNKIVCEDGNITLSCGPNSRVAVYSVLFGRSKDGSLSCPQPKGVAEEDCQASFATEMVMQRCHGYRTCHLTADASIFGRPCSKATKMYMKTVYTCVPRKILKSNYQGDLEDDEEPEADEDQEANNLLRPGSTPVGSSDAPAVSPGTGGPPPKGDGGGLVPYPAIAPTKYPTNFDQPHRTSSPFFNPTLHPKGYKPTQGEAAHPPETDRPYGQRDGTPVRQPDLINCTVTILSGSQDTTIGFITEWMRAGSFIKRNYEKLILYLVVGLAAGILVVMLVLVFRLLLDRRRTKKEAKMFNEPLTSVFAADIDEIDGDLDIMGNMGTSSSLAGGSPPPPPPSTASHEAISGRDVVRYNTTRPGIRRQDSDTNPRSLSRTNNNQLFYS